MTSHLVSTIDLLRRWGNWGRDNTGDYPSMSATFGERTLRTPLHGGTMPADMLDVDLAVCRVSWAHREWIIRAYCRHMTHDQLAAYFLVKRWKVAVLLREAESAVHQQLQVLRK